MVEHPREDISDRFCWWCSHCKTRKTIKEGSFFKKSHMTLRQWLLLLHLWAKKDPVTSAAEDLEISRPAAIDAYQWLQEVCSTTLLQTSIILGGAGCIVQIDESLFQHMPKVIFSRCGIICILTPCKYSITGGDQQHKSSGCSVSLMFHINQLLGTWRWSPGETQTLYCPSFRHMFIREQ